jgi:hypothetical protein
MNEEPDRTLSMMEVHPDIIRRQNLYGLMRRLTREAVEYLEWETDHWKATRHLWTQTGPIESTKIRIPLRIVSSDEPPTKS